MEEAYNPDYARLFRKHVFMATGLFVVGPALGLLVVWLIGSFSAATFNIGQWTETSRFFAMVIGLLLGVIITFCLFVVMDYYALKYEEWREEAREKHGQWLEAKNRPGVKDKGRRLNV